MFGVNGDKRSFVSVCFSVGKSMSKRPVLLAEGNVNGG